MATKKKAKPLTEAQMRVLRNLSDDKYEFPEGRMIRTFEILESGGYVRSKFDVASRNFATGMVHMKNSYKRTPAGKALAESLNHVMDN